MDETLEKTDRKLRLPTSWAQPRFRDVFDILSTTGKRVKQREYQSFGALPVIDQGEDFIGGYTNNLDSAIEVEKPVIVFGDHTRIFKFVRDNFAPGADGIKVFRTSAALIPKYAYYACKNLRLPDRGYSRHFSILKKFKIPVAPRNEQHRIVEKIETLFARIDKGEEALRQVQKLLKRYRQSILKAAVTGELTRDWREANQHQLEPASDLLERILETRRKNWQGRGKYKEPVELDVTDLPELPQGWVWISVDHLLREGLSNGRSVRSSHDGFPVLTLTALKNGHIDLTERKIGDWTRTEAAPYCIQEGDVLASRGNGSKHLVGRGGLVREKPDSVAFPDTMIRIPLNLTCTNPEWFIHLWNSTFIRGQIESCAKTTAGIYKINQSDIRSFEVPLPPLPEQRAISAKIDELVTQVTNLEAVCEKELARASSLRQSILKSAFTGQLVPQDPNDEPASELLARIRAEREATP